MPIPPELMDRVFIPAYLNIPPHIWCGYAEIYREKTRRLVRRAIAAGWFGNPMMIDAPED